MLELIGILTKEFIYDIIQTRRTANYFMKKQDIKNSIEHFLQNRILLYCVVLLLVLKIVTVLVFINFPQNIFFADITKLALETFANQTRQSLGLEPLIENQKLNEAAQLKAEDMVQNQYFSHTSPTGVSPWFWFSKAGYNYKYAGENLAIGFFDSEEVYNAWLNSPSHKANLINPNYKEVGTAVLNGYGQNNTIVVVQLFGKLQPVKSVAKNDNTVKPAVKESDEPVPVVGTEEKVLSQSTESKTVFEELKNGVKNDFYSRFLNFVLYNFNELLQNIIYGVSLVAIGILLAIIFFSSDILFKKEFVFRSIVIIILLSAAALLNKEMIILIIPHQVII
jgi:hypothetical protein